MLLQGPLDLVQGQPLGQTSSVEPSDAYTVDGCDDIERLLHALSADGEPMAVEAEGPHRK